MNDLCVCGHDREDHQPGRGCTATVPRTYPYTATCLCPTYETNEEPPF